MAPGAGFEPPHLLCLTPRTKDDYRLENFSSDTDPVRTRSLHNSATELPVLPASSDRSAKKPFLMRNVTLRARRRFIVILGNGIEGHMAHTKNVSAARPQ